MTGSDATQVTIINSEAWAARPGHLAQLLGRAAHGSVIPGPGGGQLGDEGVATVTDPAFWSVQPEALAEALGDRAGGRPLDQPPTGRASGAATTGNPGRLTLTVEEAAGLLGISRAFAYEAVRRGEIPSIRIGRRVLVPRVALDRLVSGETAGGAPDE